MKNLFKTLIIFSIVLAASAGVWLYLKENKPNHNQPPQPKPQKVILGKDPKTWTPAYLEKKTGKNKPSTQLHQIYLASNNGVEVGAENSDNTFTFTTYLKNPKNVEADKRLRILSIINDHQEIIYAATNHGLYVGTKNQTGGYDFKRYSRQNSDLANNTIQGITFDNNKIYMATASGVTVAQRNKSGNMTFANYPIMAGGISGAYQVAAKNDVIYVATSFGGISVGRKQQDGQYSFTNYNLENSALESNNIYGITVDGAGVIFAATTNGLAIGTPINGGGYNFETYNTKNSSLTGNTLNSIAIDLKGTLFVSTAGEGLNIGKMVNGRYVFKAYTTDAGLASNRVNSVTIDKNGFVYVATVSDNLNVGGLSIGKEQKNGEYRFTDYTVKNGLSGNNINDVSVDDSVGW